MLNLPVLKAVSQIFPEIPLPTWETENATKNLQTAIFKNNESEISKILSAKPALLNQPLPDGELPLHAAVRLKKAQIVDLLFSLGADPSQRDFQGLTALDYAVLMKDVELVRKLLPSNLIKKIDVAALNRATFKSAAPSLIDGFLKKIEAHQFFNPQSEIAKAIKAGNNELVIQLLNKGNNLSVDDVCFALIHNEECFENCLNYPSFKALLNKVNSSGISPMHLIASLRDEKKLRDVLASGGDLFLKNNKGVSPADILFSSVKNDPLKLSKVQLLLGLVSLGGIFANSYILPAIDQETASYWTAGMLLMNIGMDLGLSYNAYCQLNPESVCGKVLYWTTALGSIPAHMMLHEFPVAKEIWNLWRIGTVCERALSQTKKAWQNINYDFNRSLQVVGTELLTVGTSIYQMREMIYKVKDLYNQVSSLPRQKAMLENERALFENERTIFEKERKAWKSGIAKEPICQDVLKQQQDTWEAKLIHPSLPYLLSGNDLSGSKLNSEKQAVCRLLGADLEENRFVKLDVEKKYKELALMYHPDKCPKNLKPVCQAAYVNLQESYDELKGKKFSNLHYCSKPLAPVMKKITVVKEVPVIKIKSNCTFSEYVGQFFN